MSCDIVKYMTFIYSTNVNTIFMDSRLVFGFSNVVLNKNTFCKQLLEAFFLFINLLIFPHSTKLSLL